MRDTIYLVLEHPQFAYGSNLSRETWCDSYEEALSVAQDAAEETYVPHIVLEVCDTIEPPTPPTMEEYYGLTPGVDFPATLFPSGRTL